MIDQGKSIFEQKEPSKKKRVRAKTPFKQGMSRHIITLKEERL